ncbi:transglycosylase SLT domain-containing protein [Dasania sp. GY-19]|uniref:Transglycosylase SLT domain-containing protein n=2 Tax=Dasania TaxID=503005 RepID=A0A9J6RQU9_9GAMM|nr:transglycosylase SLT domain-containing protein [Dasania phycosphaerae]MCZ0866738.1 transglycosylase SLT domain-containing protein [Dasania phycosphaerae]
MNHCLLKPWIAGVALMQSVTTVALENIPVAYLIVAKSYHVPVDILYAMALAESGTHYRGEATPWPWALNIDGQSVFCESQQDAVYRVSQAIRHEQSVDIGLMQVNWRWHRQRFSTIDESLVPIKNLSVGAAILYEQFERTNDWWEAVGRYHDPGQDRASLDSAQRYRERVKQRWQEWF